MGESIYRRGILRCVYLDSRWIGTFFSFDISARTQQSTPTAARGSTGRQRIGRSGRGSRRLGSRGLRFGRRQVQPGWVDEPGITVNWRSLRIFRRRKSELKAKESLFNLSSSKFFQKPRRSLALTDRLTAADAAADAIFEPHASLQRKKHKRARAPSIFDSFIRNQKSEERVATSKSFSSTPCKRPSPRSEEVHRWWLSSSMIMFRNELFKFDDISLFFLSFLPPRLSFVSIQTKFKSLS